ncbi:glycosyl transferase family 1 [Spirochaetia bacterium]|nr:glycosyl transferase family 1 [Spirochaetia bacterium]
MKICILTPRFPFPENGGDIVRINGVCRYLKNKGHSLILVSFCSKFDIKNKNNLPESIYDKIYYIKRNGIISIINSLFALLINKPMQIGYYFSIKYLFRFKKIVKEEKPDIFISHLLRMVPYLNICHLQERSIVDFPDVFSKIYDLSKLSYNLSLKKIIYFFEKNLILTYEQKTIALYKKCVLVSRSDKEYLGNPDSVFVYSNGVQYVPVVHDNYNHNKMVFIGNMRTVQNQDAVKYFVNDIFPIIKISIPEAVFYIIGAEPPADIINLSDNKNIIVTGYVDSVENAIIDSSVAVAPIRIASGIQNKVLIAMACGIPVILTRIISMSIPELKTRENCIIADEKQEIADAVVFVMKNIDIRNKIGKSGYELVKTVYSWEKQLNGYESGIKAD